jgi:hypothetical protein
VRPVLGQTTGPFDISSNINLVESLNADLLDDNHGTYSTNNILQYIKEDCIIFVSSKIGVSHLCVTILLLIL